MRWLPGWNSCGRLMPWPIRTAAGMVPGVQIRPYAKRNRAQRGQRPYPGGTLRTFQDEAFDHITCRAAEIGQAQQKNGLPNLDTLQRRISAGFNDPALYDRAVRLLGRMDFSHFKKPALIAEDFPFTSRYCQVCSFSWASVGTTRFTLPAFSLTKRCWNRGGAVSAFATIFISFPPDVKTEDL